MPKPYLIGIEVEEIALGSVMRKLHAIPGIAAIHFDFDKKPHASSQTSDSPEHPKPAKAKANGANGASKTRPTFSETGQEALLKLLKGGKPKSLQALRDGFAEMGRAPVSVNYVLHALQKDKSVHRVGPSLYAKRTPKKSASK